MGATKRHPQKTLFSRFELRDLPQGTCVGIAVHMSDTISGNRRPWKCEVAKSVRTNMRLAKTQTGTIGNEMSSRAL